ncbi:MAG: acyl-CoA thioesterase [Bdellovibrionota bacterium]|nr:acyl-CoA thioesterase [Deltaproteobacteria bacterium]
MKAKSPKESKIQKIEHVLPGYTNTLGTVFGGKVMEWVDIAGAVCALRHARRPVVTASIDRVDFHAPARVGHLMILDAHINYTGRTSMEIQVQVTAEDPLTGDQFLTTEAFLTFVAIDQNCKPVEVPPLLLETEEEKQRFAEGKKRKEERVQSRTNKHT